MRDRACRISEIIIITITITIFFFVGVVSGMLVASQPWPSMARTIFGDHQRYLKTYFPYEGHFLTGDRGAARRARARSPARS